MASFPLHLLRPPLPTRCTFPVSREDSELWVCAGCSPAAVLLKVLQAHLCEQPGLGEGVPDLPALSDPGEGSLGTSQGQAGERVRSREAEVTGQAKPRPPQGPLQWGLLTSCADARCPATAVDSDDGPPSYLRILRSLIFKIVKSASFRPGLGRGTGVGQVPSRWQWVTPSGSDSSWETQLVSVPKTQVHICSLFVCLLSLHWMVTEGHPCLRTYRGACCAPENANRGLADSPDALCIIQLRRNGP